jgi:hypothetical protein
MSGVSVFPDHSHEKGSSQKKKKDYEEEKKRFYTNFFENSQSIDF